MNKPIFESEEEAKLFHKKCVRYNGIDGERFYNETEFICELQRCNKIKKSDLKIAREEYDSFRSDFEVIDPRISKIVYALEKKINLQQKEIDSFNNEKNNKEGK